MKVFVVLLLVATVASAQHSAEEDDRDKRQTQTSYFGQAPRAGSGSTGAQLQRFSSFGSTPQGFRSPLDDDDVVARNTVTPTPRPQSTRRPTPPADQARDYQHTAPQYRPQPQQQQQQQQQRRPAGPPQRGYPQPQQQLLEEEELEEEKPDRLTLLLPQSKFDCSAKQTGYYADDGLGCEVFHYCQDNAKHSWICPEGFVFHQVHLICMPPSGDNICAQSSNYHFVNEYLYRPINSEEHQQKPNISLRYADRYYPENYYDGQLDEPQPQRQAAAAPVQQQQQPQQQQVRRPVPHAQQLIRPQQQVVRTQQQFVQSTARPYTPQQVQRHPVQQAPPQFLRPQSNQVFHSPEEVNIPLQHRRATPPPRNHFQQRDDDEDEDDEEYEYEDPAPHRQG